MRASVIRKTPAPPPIDKVILEFEEAEAEKLLRLFNYCINYSFNIHPRSELPDAAEFKSWVQTMHVAMGKPPSLTLG